MRTHTQTRDDRGTSEAGRRTGHPGSGVPAPPARWRYPMLALGAAVQLLAVGGRWDIAAAAWLFPVLLLRFGRTGRVASGMLWLWLANIAAAVFWLFESALGFSPVTLGGAVALAALLTVPYLLDRLLVRRLRPWMALLVYPSAVVAAEFVITQLTPFGGAYGSLAATQYGNLPLLQLVSVTGSYGIGFLIAWCAGVVNLVWETASWRPVRRAVFTYTAALLAVLLAGGARIAFFPSGAPTVRVAGITADTSALRAQKAALSHVIGGRRSVAAAPPAGLEPAMNAVADSLLAGTRREAAAGAKIVVWPEGGVRTLEAHERAAIAAAQHEARRSGIYLEISLSVYSTTGPAYGRDEALLIDPHGTVLWTYQKAHPVPGSEPFTPGDGKVPVATTPYGRLANVICYDADFPGMMRVPADIMLVPSHDWAEYGRPHTQKAALRAVESGYALVRQDAEGVATAYDNRGQVLATTDYFTTGRQTTVAYVPTRGATTIYDRIGDTFAWLCLAAVAALLATGVLRARSPRERMAAQGDPTGAPAGEMRY
ncbi:nitrilase-related carbon-nitrogen hydrolase [Streptomyces sp. YGL11-2]|uniref:nitrilase-related carbon-nitrogen hydrolase n=1 Tax=Streptomyces sp. YGL11-2 TaxID=3414028 RepID=UPI003CFA48E4